MAAQHFSLAPPTHEAEKQAIRHLVEGLPSGYTVYSNAWLVEHSGAVYELDAVVVAPHAIFIVEIKSFRNEIRGNDFDWYIPEPYRSPLRLNHKTAQVLSGILRRRSFDAGSVWVEGYVYLSHTSQVRVEGDASRARLHTRQTLIPALTDAQVLYRRLRNQPPPVDDSIRQTLHLLLTGAKLEQKPVRRVREYVLESVLDRTEHYQEYLARHDVSGVRRVLRIYPLPALEDETTRRRKEERWRWEAQILAQVGQHPNILSTDPPFLDEIGMCLPFEYFSGISLTSWLERHRQTLTGRASLEKRLSVWKKIVSAILYAHRKGVVHRLLRPESILIQDTANTPDIRLIGFDLAKQIASDQTIHVSTLHDDRLKWAAPEVVQDFSRAEPRSDQFSLGALLGFILAGRPLFDTTQNALRAGSIVVRIRDLNPSVPKTLDDAVKRMLAYRPEDRFPTLKEALSEVEDVLGRPGRGTEQLALSPRTLPAFDQLTPGTRIGPDYEIVDTLGAGGLATVYAAKHLVSGAIRALKVARDADGADETLLAEYEALRQLDHRAIVRAVDLSNILEPRRTLILERIKGIPLSRWLLEQTQPEAQVLQRFAEDLLGALAYLEEKDVIHKDLKPDNLIVGVDGLTVIDFSLAKVPPDQTSVGTPLYRDPALKVWNHAADRYAAALCLFELYTGRHAFDGHAPAPDEETSVDDDEFDAPGLTRFFLKALHPSQSLRHPSALAMRSAFHEALRTQTPLEAPEAHPTPAAPHTLLSATPPGETPLGPSWITALRRAGIYTRLELASTDEARLRSIRGLGSRGREAVLALRTSLRTQGLGLETPEGPAAPSLMPLLVGDDTPIHRLGLAERLTDALATQGFRTIGRLAASTRAQVQEVPQLGARALQQVIEALQRFAERQADAPPPFGLGSVWQRLTDPLSPRQRQVLEATLGLDSAPRKQQEIAELMAISQATVSLELRASLSLLDKSMLPDVQEVLEILLENAGGLQRLDVIANALHERWPGADEPLPAALVRLILLLDDTRMTLREGIPDVPGPLLVRPWFTQDMLRAFALEAQALAEQWPIASDTARRSLAALLPEYCMDPLALAGRLLEHLHVLPGGELVIPPLDAGRAIGFLLRRERLPIPLLELQERMENTFGDAAPWPGTEALPHVFAHEALREFRLEGDRVETAALRSISPIRPVADALPQALRQLARTPEALVGDLLRQAARSRGYRLVVTPPEKHPDLGRSVARALGPDAEFISFEHRLLERLDDDFSTYERAERFPTDRDLLTEAAEALLFDLLDERGRPGLVTVLGDTALFQLCEATHLVRRLYDETLNGTKGFWALVIPGVIQERQPRFNERIEVFHLDGATLPLNAEIP